MSKRSQTKVQGDALLEEVWHATARAPRDGTYDTGLDVLGAGIASKLTKRVVAQVATPVVRATKTAAALAMKLPAAKRPAAVAAAVNAAVARKVSQSAASGTSAANRAIATGNKIATRMPNASRKLLSLGQKLLSATAKQKATVAAATAVHGLDAGALALAETYDPTATAAYDNFVAATAAVTSAGELGYNLLAIVNQCQTAGLTDVATQGQAIVDQCQQLIDNYNPGVDDAGVATSFSGIQSSATTWQAQAQAALSGAPGAASAPGSFDPGSAGGGGGSDSSYDGGGGASPDDGGGGGGDGGSAEADDEPVDSPSSSDAVRRFRESGGTDDPFDDDDGSGNGDGTDSGDGTDAASSDDTGDADAVVGLLSVFGLGPSDYHFEVSDLFMPHQALQRTIQEKHDKEAAAVAMQPISTTDTTPAAAPSPEIAAKLTAAKKRLADVKRKEAAFRAGQAAGSAALSSPSSAPSTPGAPDGSAPPAAPADGEVVVGLKDIVFGALETGFEAEEVADLLLDTWTQEITDEPQDPERRRASVHRGAAYLQDITYPPHGASAGQEGGTRMRPEQTIEVFGSAYARGLDVLGAPQTLTKRPLVPKRAGFVAKRTPAGNVHTSLVLNKTKKGDHKNSIKNARDAGKRAVSLGQKLQKVLAKPGVMKAVPTAVHGVGTLARHAPARPTQHFSAAQLKKVADNAVKAGKAVIAAADKHQKYTDGINARLKAAVSNVQQKTRPSGKTGFHGDVVGSVIEALGEDADIEMLGDAIADVLFGETTIVTPGLVQPTGLPAPSYDPTTDPSSPSYDPTMDPNSPSYVDPSGGASATAGPPDYGLGPPPTVAPPLVAGQDYLPSVGNDVATAIYSSDASVPGSTPIPDGAVIYDGSVPFPAQALGSYSRFNGSGPGGVVPDGGTNSGFEWHTDGWWFWYGSAYNDGAAVDLRWSRPNPKESGDLKTMYDASLKHNWGPLIGNPGGGDFAGLRYDRGADKWFWFYDTAPQWAKQSGPNGDQARLNQAILDYKAAVTAAAADAAAQAAADKLAADQATALAKQQALEDASNQRAMDQEQAAAEHQAQIQQLADQTNQSAATAQSETEDASAIRQAQAQAEIDRQAADQQAELDAKANEREAELEAKMYERLQQIDATAPPPSPDAGEPGDAGGGGVADGDQMTAPDVTDETTLLDDDTTDAVFGDALTRLRGGDRIRLRRAIRRG